MSKLKNALFSLLLGLLPLAAFGQQYAVVPDKSVVGRIGVGNQSGPSQPIPFSILLQQLLTTAPITNSQLSTMAPWTIKMNNSASSATPQDVTIDGLTLKAIPTSSDEIPLWDAATSSMKKATVGTIATVGAVTSINGQAGPINLQGATNNGAGTIYTQLGGYVNKLRNSSLIAWFHGCVGSACTITTSGGWCAEGIYVKPTGASVTCQQTATCPTGSPTRNCVKITSNTSVTAIQVRFVVESYDAAPLAGLQTTFQFLWLNNCGSSVTPTISANYPTAQDNYASTSADLASANLQATTNGTSQTESYSWAANAGITAGDSIDIGFGTCGASASDSFTIAGGFDWRYTPGQSTGTVSSNLPNPEIRTAADDIAWNQRFYAASYENGTAPASSTHNGIVFGGFNVTSSGIYGTFVAFPQMLRAAPSAVSFWDGAGNASKTSTLTTATTSTFTDNSSPNAGTPIGTLSARGFIASMGVTSSNTPGFFHYAADVTITGG